MNNDDWKKKTVVRFRFSVPDRYSESSIMICCYQSYANILYFKITYMFWYLLNSTVNLQVIISQITNNRELHPALLPPFHCYFYFHFPLVSFIDLYASANVLLPLQIKSEHILFFFSLKQRYKSNSVISIKPLQRCRTAQVLTLQKTRC